VKRVLRFLFLLVLASTVAHAAAADEQNTRARARRFLVVGDFASARKEIYALLSSESANAKEKAAALELMFVLDVWSQSGGRPASTTTSEPPVDPAEDWDGAFAAARSILAEGDFDEATRRLDALLPFAPNEHKRAATSELHFLALEAKRDLSAEPAPPPQELPPAKVQEDFPRWRWGVSGLGGPFYAGSETGGFGGIAARTGLQAGNAIAIYVQPFALLGRGTSSGLAAAAGIGVLADVTIADLVYLAVGPELFGVSDGPRVSFVSRAGIALGSTKPDRRSALVIGLDLRLVATPGGPASIPLLSVGYEAF
jgi:hypothetical protein